MIVLSDDIVEEWGLNENVPPEMTAEEAAEYARRKAMAASASDARDAGYYFCVYFATSRECDEFLRKSGFPHDGTSNLNGRDLAKMLNIHLETAATLPRPKQATIIKRRLVKHGNIKQRKKGR